MPFYRWGIDKSLIYRFCFYFGCCCCCCTTPASLFCVLVVLPCVLRLDLYLVLPLLIFPPLLINLSVVLHVVLLVVLTFALLLLLLLLSTPVPSSNSCSYQDSSILNVVPQMDFAQNVEKEWQVTGPSFESYSVEVAGLQFTGHNSSIMDMTFCTR